MVSTGEGENRGGNGAEKRRVILPSASSEQKALGLAYPGDPTAQRELLTWAGGLDEEEFIRLTQPVVLMEMMSLRGRSANQAISSTEVTSFAINIPNLPGRNHRLVTLPTACKYAACTICDYCSKGKREITGRDIDRADIDRAIEIVRKDNDFYLEDGEYHRQHPEDNVVLIDITAGGSIFNSREVPDEIRQYLWKKIAEYGKEQKAKGRYVAFVTETRVDDLSETTLKEMFAALEGGVDEVEVGYGLERIDPLGQKIMMNKMMPPDWEERVKLLKNPEINRGIDVVGAAHVMLTVPGETDAEGVEYASQSIRELIDKGLCDTVVLMATNKKAATVPGVIESELPSIFTLAETLKRLRELGERAGNPDKYLREVLVRGFAGIAEEIAPEKVKYMKAGCNACRPVEELLKDWRPEDYSKLIELISQTNCQDKADWEAEILQEPQYSRQQRIALILDYLAKTYWKMSLKDAVEAFGDINLHPQFKNE